MRAMWTSVATAALVLMAGTSFGQSSAAARGSVQASASANGATAMQNVQATLVKGVDARNAKVGQEVLARTTADFMANGMKVARGSRLIGHVTEAQAKGKGSAESRLGMLFDRVEPRSGGAPLPVALHIAGLGAAPVPTTSMEDQADVNEGMTTPGANAGASANTRASSGGLLGGVTNTVGGVGRTVGNVGSAAVDTVGGAVNTTGQLARGTVATVGSTVNGIAITTTGAAGTVLTSTTRDVQLQGGTSLMLTGSASAR